MSDMNTKIDRFAAAIVAEATADTERTLSQLSERRASAYTAAEEQVLGDVYRYIHGEVARLKTEAGRQVSRHMLENKRTLYLRREAIAGQVCGEVRTRLTDYTATPAYAHRMAALYADALAGLSGAAEVRLFLRPADAGLAVALTAVKPEVKVQVLEGDFLLGGLIADAPALGKRVDATFDSAMDELSGHFAELFGLSLPSEMDEGGEHA